MAYETYPVDPLSGWLMDSDGNVINIADLLGGSEAMAGYEVDPKQFPAYPLTVVGSDGTIYNLADLLKNIVSTVATMPEASEALLGRVVTYMGVTDTDYTHGKSYECVEASEDVYSWSEL